MSLAERADRLTANPRFGWSVAVFLLVGLLNFGAPHAEAFKYFRSLEEDSLVWNMSTAWTALRSCLTDDGDLRRYYYYAQAALGRHHLQYYVRSQQEWADEFISGKPGPGPDATPQVTLDHRLIPYRDYLVEYPPPFFAWALPLAAVSPNEDVFRVLTGAFMGLLMLLSFWVSGRLLKELPPSAIRPERLAFLGAAACACLGLVTTHRFDAWIALLCVVTIWQLVLNRPIGTGLALGAAIGIKLVPVLIAPLVALWFWRERRLRDLFVCAGVTAAVTLACFAPGLALAGGHLFDMLHYHDQRPLQVESTAAAMLTVWRAIQPDSLHPVWSYGSSNVEGAYTPIALRLLNPLLVVSLLATYASAWVRLAREPNRRARALILVQHTTLALVAMMVIAKVFSPQYLLWILPLALIQAIGRGTGATLVLLAILGLTQLIFPGLYKSIEYLPPWPCVLILLRNLALLAWAWTALPARAQALETKSAPATA